MVLANINSTSPVSTSRLSLSPLISHTGFQDAEKKCQLLGPVALVVQGCMGVFVVLSLVVKRQYEGNAKKGIPRRRWRVWSMDVGKQLIGQGFVHFLNVWVSTERSCDRRELRGKFSEHLTIGIDLGWSSITRGRHQSV